MFQPWRAEDFSRAGKVDQRPVDFWEPGSNACIAVEASEPQHAHDFWQPSALQQPTVSDDRSGGERFVSRRHDFWDPVPSPEFVVVSRVSDWSDGIALPQFQGRASENPFYFSDVLPTHEGVAQRRARWLANLLDIPTMSARRWFASRFEELFDEFPHNNTFRVLSELAVEGASADEVLTGFELKLVWADHPVFWSIRRKGHRGPLVPDGGDKLLGWTRAIRLANLAKGLPAERIIDADWYEEWLRLPYGDPLFWSFLEYATERLEAFSRGALSVPETLARVEEGRHEDFKARSITIDGLKIGSVARTGILMQSLALQPSKPIPFHQAEQGA